MLSELGDNKSYTVLHTQGCKKSAKHICVSAVVPLYNTAVFHHHAPLPSILSGTAALSGITEHVRGIAAAEHGLPRAAALWTTPAHAPLTAFAAGLPHGLPTCWAPLGNMGLFGM